MKKKNKPNDVLVAIIELPPVLCFATDENFITTYINPFCKQTQSLIEKDVVSKHIKHVIGEEGFKENLHLYKKVLAGEVVSYDASLNKQDGTIHHYRATCSPIIHKGFIVGITGVVLDITSEKEMVNTNRELREANIELKQALKLFNTLKGTLPLCSFCKQIKDDKDCWGPVDIHMNKQPQANISHGICPECLKRHYPEAYKSMQLNHITE